MDHELVPKHEILNEKEKKALLEKLEIQEKSLPKILESDPVVKIMNAKPGQVLRITRESPTAGETTYYRFVAEE